MNEHQAEIHGGVSDQFRGFVVSLVSAFVFFKLFTSWFAHEDAPAVDGLVLSVTLVVVLYLWLRQTQALWKLRISQRHLAQSQAATIGALAKAIEAKDPYTEGHSERVSSLSVKLATKLQFTEDAVGVIGRAARLHDIGKLGISDEILHKSTPLTNEEWEIIKEHPQRASDILSTLLFLEQESRIALLHHERYDGTGYPLRLKTDEIPVEASIVAVADGFDAMNSKRAYRDRMPREQVIGEITKGRGTQYDPVVAEAFLALLGDMPELWTQST